MIVLFLKGETGVSLMKHTGFFWGVGQGDNTSHLNTVVSFFFFFIPVSETGMTNYERKGVG